jgi:hypothetical protein
MVSKRGKSGYRSFTIAGAAKRAGVATKGLGGRFINRSPADAARKAFTELCRIKKIRGICTLFVTMKETTKGGRNNGKLYTYKLQRNKLAKPMIMLEGTEKEFVIEYKSKIVRVMKGQQLKPEGDDQKGSQTRGRRKRRTAKKTRVTANNVRKMTASVKRPVRRSRRASAAPVRRSKRLAAKRQ